MKSFITAILLTYSGLIAVSHGQEPVLTEQGGQGGAGNLWEAVLPDGNLIVALNKVASVSRHKYVLDGAMVVDEVTIDTVGQALARFYFVSPITSEGPGAVANIPRKGLDRVSGLGSGKGVNVQNMVVKKYPITSHAKSIEFRILSEKQLDDLFKSAQEALKTGRGRSFTAE